MNTYKLYGLAPDGRVLFGEELRAADLDQACSHAEAALTRAASVELWQETVRVWRRAAPVA